MKVLVTGGSGFLGKALCKMLLAQGDQVNFLSRNNAPSLESLGAKWFKVDLAADPSNAAGSETEETGYATLESALEGVELVYHVASKTGIHGSKESFQRINVAGTERMLEASKAAGIRKFIYTSSPSAVFGQNTEGADESECDYPTHFDDIYSETKAQAEKMVLAANGPEMATVALRPHLIFGPEDPNLIPRLIERQKDGRLARVGSGKNRVSITYIDNAAAAHMQVARKLEVGSEVAGKAYFITDDEPVYLWPWIDNLLTALGLGPVKKKVPFALAYGVGALTEFGHWLLRKKEEPTLTRFLVRELSDSHFYKIEAAKRDFGYQTVISPEEALRRTVEYFKKKLEQGSLP